jgi:hypothetical protein
LVTPSVGCITQEPFTVTPLLSVYPFLHLIGVVLPLPRNGIPRGKAAFTGDEIKTVKSITVAQKKFDFLALKAILRSHQANAYYAAIIKKTQ